MKLRRAFHLRAWPILAKLTVSVTALVVVGLAVITVLSVRSEQQELRLALETRGSAILDSVVVTGLWDSGPSRSRVLPAGLKLSTMTILSRQHSS